MEQQDGQEDAPIEPEAGDLQEGEVNEAAADGENKESGKDESKQKD